MKVIFIIFIMFIMFIINIIFIMLNRKTQSGSRWSESVFYFPFPQFSMSHLPHKGQVNLCRWQRPLVFQVMDTLPCGCGNQKKAAAHRAIYERREKICTSRYL